jgi:hypothetical protein
LQSTPEKDQGLPYTAPQQFNNQREPAMSTTAYNHSTQPGISDALNEL